MTPQVQDSNDPSPREASTDKAAQSGGRNRPETPFPLAASLAVIGLVAAAIAIAGAPAWVIGLTIGALLAIAIPQLRRRALRWPTEGRASALAAILIAMSAGVGVAVGELTSSGAGKATIRSARPDIAATGYVNGHWIEQEGEASAEAFGEPGVEATRSGHRVPPFAFVVVSCRQYVSGIESAHPDGYWYRIASKPWRDEYYVAANTFWNGSSVVRGPGVKNTDFRVPVCK